MDDNFSKLTRFMEFLNLHGHHAVKALLVLIVGLVLAKLISRYVRMLLRKTKLPPAPIATVCSALEALMVIVVFAFTLEQAGVADIVIYRFLGIVGLGVVAVIILFRPYLPTVPFKPGDQVEIGGFLGIVEATSFLSTRLRTFDGRTIFINNKKILGDTVTNYDITSARQIRLDFGIGFHEDLSRVKRVLSELLEKEPMIVKKHKNRVFVKGFGENGVKLSVRFWIANENYWPGRTGVTEKVKARLDAEGIAIQAPRRDVRIRQPLQAGNVLPGSVSREI